jgi:hypothetical protein
MKTNQSMKTNLLQKVLTFLCPAPTTSTHAARPDDSLIFGNWGCAMIILFFIVIAVLNGILELFG